jgi:hypothetical protein
MRTVADALISLLLFVTILVAIGNYHRVSDATNRLGDILSISASSGDFIRFSLGDNPLMAAAAVAPEVPAQQSGAVAGLHKADQNTAFLLLGAIFSILMALNVAFIRHLCREYASPRRGAWGGGLGFC